tara:strand:- start:281 stop:991 length:711 start_codon:yes stop_codon:yes gene_type:complete
MHSAILLAAGLGTRMGKSVKDKILAPIGHSNAFRMSFSAFSRTKEISSIIIVYRDNEQKKILQNEVQLTSHSTSALKISFVKGGEQRSDSVRNGLRAIPDVCQYTHIHDCARPMIRSATIQKLISEVENMNPVALAHPAVNTIRKDLSVTDDINPMRVTETLNRNELWEMETPQSAPKSWLIKGYHIAQELNIRVTDDMHAMELLSKKIILINPGYPNPKITNPNDLRLIKFLLDS